VIAPGADLRLDQVGLAEEIAWALFSPLVLRELGDEEALTLRSEPAMCALDGVMARSWVIINRAPSLSPTSLVAFRPVRCDGYAIRLHPLACEMLNADFDGDQVAVFLPVTEVGQREAGEFLSVVGHLTRDPALLHTLLPCADALYGLALMAQSREGRARLVALVGEAAVGADGLVTRESLGRSMSAILRRDGVRAVLDVLEQLARLGFERARISGASISPFLGAGLERPPEPSTDGHELWDRCVEEVAEMLASRRDYGSPNLGPQLAVAKASGEGLRGLGRLVGPWGVVQDVDGNTVVVRHGLVEGLTADEMYALATRSRERIAGILAEWDRMVEEARARHQPKGFHVLSRARRAKHPGIVFARAAASCEVDPLEDAYSRLLVGLPV
jgi:hypothetical protein